MSKTDHRYYEDKQRRATYKWRDKNQKHIRYYRALSAAKSFIRPKAGTKIAEACRWARGDYQKDLKILQEMIEHQLKKLSK